MQSRDQNAFLALILVQAAHSLEEYGRGVIAHEVADEPRGREDLVEAEDVACFFGLAVEDI